MARSCLDKQQLVSAMSIIAKLASSALLGSVMLASSLVPAYALRMQENVGTKAMQQQAVSAYAGENQAIVADRTLLSPSEIKHIRWCAARYVFKYDPVSDTYAGASGIRLQCQSPR